MGQTIVLSKNVTRNDRAMKVMKLTIAKKKLIVKECDDFKLNNT